MLVPILLQSHVACWPTSFDYEQISLMLTRDLIIVQSFCHFNRENMTIGGAITLRTPYLFSLQLLLHDHKRKHVIYQYLGMGGQLYKLFAANSVNVSISAGLDMTQ